MATHVVDKVRNGFGVSVGAWMQVLPALVIGARVAGQHTWHCDAGITVKLGIESDGAMAGLIRVNEEMTDVGRELVERFPGVTVSMVTPDEFRLVGSRHGVVIAVEVAS
jgi:hypothetical protein